MANIDERMSSAEMHIVIYLSISSLWIHTVLNSIQLKACTNYLPEIYLLMSIVLRWHFSGNFLISASFLVGFMAIVTWL